MVERSDQDVRSSARCGELALFALRRLLVTGAAVAMALVCAGAVLWLSGQSPVGAFRLAVGGALGDFVSIGVTANRAVPFALAGLGFVVAYRAGLLNIGAEGQIFLGGAAAGAVALTIGPSLGGVLGIVVALAAASIAGAMLSLLAGALYVWRGVSVVLSTLLLNFVAIQVVSYLVRSPHLLQEQGTVGTEEGFGGTARAFAQSDQVAVVMRLPRLVVGNNAHLGLVVVLLALIAVVVMLRGTAFGFRIRVLGAGPRAAEHGGMRVTRTVLSAMAVCGALGGLAGATIVLGDRFRVLETVSEGYGYIAILAALLARVSPIGTVFAAFFFATLQRGGQIMEAGGMAPESTVLIVQGLAVLLIVGAFEMERRRSQRAARRKVA
jgi:simple sugar transport system permease protein